MKKRLLTTAVGLPLVFLVLYGYPGAVYDVVLLAACLIGYYEAWRAYGQRPALGLVAVLAALTAAYFLAPALWAAFAPAASRAALGRVLLCVALAALLLCVLRHFQQLDIARMAGMLLLCALTFFCFGRVLAWKRMLPFDEYGYLGAFLILLALAYAWGGDSFAFLAGSAFGRRKLCPNISPHKTVAGAIGAPVGSVLFGVLFLWAYQALMPLLQPHALLELPGWAYVAVAAAGVPASLLGMAGDLYFSCVKRQLGIKDYGTLLPGQGGILDRFDSAVPVVALLDACLALWRLLA